MPKIKKYLLALLAIASIFLIVVFEEPIYAFMLFFAIIIILAINGGAKQDKFEYLQQILATSKINAVASGLAEIIGVAKPYTQIIDSPIAKLPCIAYIYTVEEKRVSRDSEGREQVNYVEIERRVDCDRFYLQDASGQIEINAKNLAWFGFPIASEYSSGSYRYREYILDENRKILIIGQAWYQDSQPIFQYSTAKQIFAMAPFKWVLFRNKWRPLKQRAGLLLGLLGLFIIFVLLMPINLDGTKLIFGLNNMANINIFFD